MSVPLPFKLMLFLGLWYETAGQFRLGVDTAFVATLFVFYGTWFVQRFAGEVAGLPEELTAALIVRGFLWIIVYCWLAPDILRAQPWSFIVCVLVMLVLAGMRCREQFDRTALPWGKAFLRQHSEAVAGGALAAVGTACLAQQRWGSMLPLVGYIALVGLPFSFGWMGGAPVQPRFDASFAEEETVQDAGVSDEY